MKEKQTGFWAFIKPARLRYGASVLLAVLSVFCGILPYLVAYRLVLRMTEGVATTQVVLLHAIAVLGFFALQILCYAGSTAISHVTAFGIIHRLRIAITEKLLKMPLGYTQTKGSGHLKNLLMDELERLEYPLAHAIPETSSGVLLPLCAMAVLFAMDWRMGLAATLPAVATLVFYLPMYRGIMDEFAATYYTDLENMNGQVIQYITGIKEIKIFGRAQDAYSQYEHSIDRYRDSTLRLYGKMYFVTSPAFVLLSSILVCVLCVGGLLYCNGSLPFPMFLLTIFVSVGIGAPLLKFTEFMDNFYTIKNGKRLVDEVLSAPELPQTKTPNSVVTGCNIAFHNVSFAYEENAVLENISIRFPQGKKTALVGPSGSGKSTIANLIARFWDVGSGSITLDGVDIRNIPLTQLMDTVSYVTQDTFLFNMSILENIRLGRPGATDAEVLAAARAAQCEEFIDELEQGYGTIAGDAGARLSGGQRQRIVIARAILKSAPVLILDEATAYADMENQQKLQASLAALCRDKTLIVIAHRMATVVDCDQIILMDGGRAVATGTHEELLQASPLYRHMWDIHLASAQWSA